MKTIYAFLLASSLLASTTATAEITRISDGGVNFNLSDHLSSAVPAVLVFHTPWDQTSISLLEQIESWAENYPNLAIFFIDVVDERTQVYHQYSLDKIPSILIFDARQEQMSGTLFDLESLEKTLQSLSIL